MVEDIALDLQWILARTILLFLHCQCQKGDSLVGMIPDFDNVFFMLVG